MFNRKPTKAVFPRNFINAVREGVIRPADAPTAPRFAARTQHSAQRTRKHDEIVCPAHGHQSTNQSTHQSVIIIRRPQ